MQWYDRTKLLVGDEKYQRLQKSHIMVVGLGGVGGFAAESICRAGVGKMTIVDGDTISVDNRNRQLVSLHSTTGRKKADALRDRLLDINPDVNVRVVDTFLLNNNITELVQSDHFDYVIDAIDTLTPKTQLIMECLNSKLNIVSSMGAGAKFDPTKIRVADISQTFKCPLAKRVRDRLKENGITQGFKTVFSSEGFDRDRFIITDGSNNKKTVVGTISYLPPIFGGYCAAIAIQHLLD